MKADSQLARQAWVDDQLTVDEVIRLEEQLTPSERHDLARERSFEQSLAAVLRQGPDCPEALWQRLQAELRAASTMPAPPAPRRIRAQQRRVYLAAAAALAVLLGFVLWPRPKGDLPQFMAKPLDSDPTVFAAAAQVPGDLAKMRSALSGAGIHLTLSAPPAGHHAIVPLGMRLCQYQGQPVAVLYYTCCDKPMMVVVTARDTLDPARLPLADLPPGTQLGLREIDGYRVLVFGQHGPNELLDLLS